MRGLKITACSITKGLSYCPEPPMVKIVYSLRVKYGQILRFRNSRFQNERLALLPFGRLQVSASSFSIWPSSWLDFRFPLISTWLWFMRFIFIRVSVFMRWVLTFRFLVHGLRALLCLLISMIVRRFLVSSLLALAWVFWRLLFRPWTLMVSGARSRT